MQYGGMRIPSSLLQPLMEKCAYIHMRTMFPNTPLRTNPVKAALKNKATNDIRPLGRTSTITLHLDKSDFNIFEYQPKDKKVGPVRVLHLCKYVSFAVRWTVEAFSEESVQTISLQYVPKTGEAFVLFGMPNGHPPLLCKADRRANRAWCHEVLLYARGTDVPAQMGRLVHPCHGRQSRNRGLATEPETNDAVAADQAGAPVLDPGGDERSIASRGGPSRTDSPPVSKKQSTISPNQERPGKKQRAGSPSRGGKSAREEGGRSSSANPADPGSSSLSSSSSSSSARSAKEMTVDWSGRRKQLGSGRPSKTAARERKMVRDADRKALMERNLPTEKGERIAFEGRLREEKDRVHKAQQARVRVLGGGGGHARF
jgi:hypothetical protein